MTANVNIKRGDLHLAVSTAFNRGRYVLMTGGGDGQPIEITIDLRERPDDLFGGEPLDFSHPVTDDHGPAIPAQDAGYEPPFYEQMRAVKGERQRESMVWHALLLYAHETESPVGESTLDWFADRAGVRLRRSDAIPRGDYGAGSPLPDEAPCGGRVSGPYIYEFTLQEARGDGLTLDTVTMDNAPLLHDCKQADWVHVYDRVTRERRTLKRPEPAAVLTGLRDVAAELRRGGKVEGPFGNGERGAEVFTPARGAPVEPPFGCAALPPVGPLTSTEGLKPGDVLRYDDGSGIVRFLRLSRFGGRESLDVVGLSDGESGVSYPETLLFVGRPDADGWMAWGGGENPVPGAMVEVRTASKGEDRAASEKLDWSEMGESGWQIVAFRIVDTPPAV